MPRRGMLIDRPDRIATVDHPSVPVIVDGTPVIAFTPRDGRVTTALVMPGIDRLVDVTVAPATALVALHRAAQSSAVPTSRAEAIARESLADAARVANAWAPVEQHELLALIGGVSFPMLADCYGAGAAPVDEVPRWASAILSERTARDAARAAFGTKATKPVTAAIARALVRDVPGPVDFSRLGFALLSADVLEPDQLVTMMGMVGPAIAMNRLPDPQGIEAGRRVTTQWGATRTLQIIRDACERPDGIELLTACIRYGDDLAGHAPSRLPSRLNELHDALRSRFSTDALPRPRHPAASGRRPRDLPHYGVHTAPAANVGATATSTRRIPHPRWLQPVGGHAFGRYRFVLPRSCGDLDRWARLLRNCIGSFGNAAVAGRSHIIGIEEDGRLVYAIEVNPQRQVRQFAGRANARPSDVLHAAVLDQLTRLRVIR